MKIHLGNPGSEVLDHLRTRSAAAYRTNDQLSDALASTDERIENILMHLEATPTGEGVAVEKLTRRHAGEELEEGDVISVLHDAPLELEMGIWIIGEDVDLDTVRKHFDHENRVLYVITSLKEGKRRLHVLGRKAWDTLQAMQQ